MSLSESDIPSSWTTLIAAKSMTGRPGESVSTDSPTFSAVGALGALSPRVRGGSGGDGVAFIASRSPLSSARPLLPPFATSQ